MSSTTIDDHDLTHITYKGTWVQGGSIHDHDETVSSSTNVGDYFNVRFSGNSITVYGTIDSTSGGVLTNYSVDNATPQQIISQMGTGDTHNQQFWKSPTLAVGEHNLNVTMVKINNDFGPGEGTIWFDYFLVEDPTIRSDTGQQITHRKRTEAIAGGVLGGVFVFILIVLFCIFLQRRKEGKRTLPRLSPYSGPKMRSLQMQQEVFSFAALNIRSLRSDETMVEPFPIGSTHDRGSPIPHGLPSVSFDVRRKATSMDPRTRPNISVQNMNPSPPFVAPASGLETIRNAVGKRQVNDAVHERYVSQARNPLPMRSWRHTVSGMQEVNLEANGSVVNLELPPVYSPI
ncbi:hypothetical protein CPB84DRAFT_1847193 [Gymnopilus junonius]|uniref:Uncharacterized protein n=1 Tax=Gymnopilus junonius TaxID=109634 RepID=A0A9P5TNE4_GYMJU|nr:hypothetical protein CPB84DRAFT_1847193 [Gymnopilus junonius]